MREREEKRRKVERGEKVEERRRERDRKERGVVKR